MKDGAKITKGCFLAFNKKDKTFGIISPVESNHPCKEILWDDGNRKMMVHSIPDFHIIADFIAQVLNLKLKLVSDESLMERLIVCELI